MLSTFRNFAAKYEYMTIFASILIILAFCLFIIIRHRAAMRLEDAYKDLERANERAKESSRMKSDFIQQISHEIRTPLNILSGYTQLLTTPGMQYDEETLDEIKQQITEIGIPHKEAERIFEEFVQLDEYYNGTGIGLTVARSLARRIGGDIMLDTAYIGGSRFVMTLPLTK